jgi:hypothetical protein
MNFQQTICQLEFLRDLRHKQAIELRTHGQPANQREAQSNADRADHCDQEARELTAAIGVLAAESSTTPDVSPASAPISRPGKTCPVILQCSSAVLQDHPATTSKETRQ